MMITPKKIKFKKVHKRNSLLKKSNFLSLSKSQYGFRSLTSGFLTEQQVNMILKLLNKTLKKNSKVFLRIFCSTPVTKKPLETRMGKGKGNFHLWKSSFKAGQILFEIQNANKITIKQIETSLNKKLPIKLKTIVFSIY